MGKGLVDKPHLQRFKTRLDETFVKKNDYATSTNFGVIRPDGTTVTVENGVLSASGKQLDYKTTEQNTYTKWIDNKDIYQITYLFNGPISCTGETWTEVTSAPYLLNTLIKGYGGGSIIVSPEIKIVNGQIYIKTLSDLDLSFLTIQYTKATSTATMYDYTWNEASGFTWEGVSNLEWKGEQ